MKKETSIKDFFKDIASEEGSLLEFIKLIQNGDTALQQSRIVETMIVDDSWIHNIETLLYSVEKIVKDPQKSIIDTPALVGVEKAKRIGAETIRHLASHTHYIRAIDEWGRIQPSKVLTKEMEEDLYIYENRFIATLITRLLAFVQQRYTAIKEQIDTYDTTSLKLNSKFKMGKGDVDIDINMKVRSSPTGGKVTLQKNHELLGKIEVLRKRVMLLTGTAFYKEISRLKPVVPPIMKTNIINMHTDYSNAYKLWVFISSYNMVGFSVDVSDKLLPIDNDYYSDLTMLIAISLKAMIENNAIREPAYRKINFRRRKTKRYRELRRIEYTPSFRGVAEMPKTDIVNQFYYDRLKELVAEQEKIKAGDLINSVTLNQTLQRVFRQITKLNNAFYKEVIETSKIEAPLKTQTPLERKSLEYKKQEELVKRLGVLSRLKANELERSLVRENTQKIRLERLRFQLERMQEKEGKKRKKKNSRKTTDTAERLSRLYARAERDEKFRMSKEFARQEAVLEKERIRLENLEKAREERRKINEMAKLILREQEEE